MRRARAASLYLLAAAAIMVFFSVVQPPRHDRLLAMYFDSGHAVVFGLLAWAGLGLWRTMTPRERRWEGYAVVFLAVTALGVLTEILQMYGSRRAEVLDVLRNIAGAAAFLLVARTRERPQSPWGALRNLALASVILLVAFLPPLLFSGAHIWRERALPLLVDYGSPWARPLWKVEGAEAKIVPAPVGFESEARKVVKVTFGTGWYPRLVLAYPYPEWRGGSVLAFEVYSRLDSTRTMNLRVHDVEHQEQLRDRYNAAFEVHPGVNRIRVPIVDIARAPETRVMDMSRIENLAVFAVHPPEPFSLWFSPFRLE